MAAFRPRFLVSLLVFFAASPLPAATAAELTVGASAADHTSVQAAVNAASAGSTITIAAGTYTENVVIDGKALVLRAADGASVSLAPTSGNAIVLRGDFGAAAVLTIDGIHIEGASIGVHVEDATVLGELVLNEMTFANSARWALMVGDGDYGSGPSTGLGKISVAESTFSLNGATHPANQGAAIKLWRYQGDLSITGSTFTGGANSASPSPANAIETQGVDNLHLADAGAIGVTVLTDVTVSGHFKKNPVAFYNYANLEALAIEGLDLAGATSNWSALFNIHGAKSPLDASAYDIVYPAGDGVTAELQGEKDNSAAANVIIGSAANERLMGKAGADWLEGGDGNDELWGADPPGADFDDEISDDTLEGGAGNDILVGGAGNDIARFTAGQGGYRMGINRFNGSRRVMDARIASPDGSDALYEMEYAQFAGGPPLDLADIAGTGLMIVDAAGNGDTTSLQAALDIAEDGDTILVWPGVYEESASGGALGLLIDKSVTILGVDADGQPVSDAGGVQATIRSLKESSWGTNFMVAAADVVIQGLRFEARRDSVDASLPAQAVNKAFEITAGGFMLSDSVVAAAAGFDFSGLTSTALYFGDENPDDLESFDVECNLLEGGITITNGAGDSGSANFRIVDNTFSGSHFLRIRGVVDGVAWLLRHAGVPDTVTGNDLTGVTAFLLQSWDSDMAWLADRAFVEKLAANNDIGPHAWLLKSNGTIGTIAYTEYGGTAPAVFVYRAAGDFASAPAGTTIKTGDTLDLDSDGTPDYADSDIDGDNIPNATEGDDDADGDGRPNDHDTDADGDGINDLNEGVGDRDLDGTPNYLDASIDEDEDGIPDIVEGAGDPDHDGLKNFLDPDSDNDGVPDEIELGDISKDSDHDDVRDRFDVNSTHGSDANGDGIDDRPLPDTDHDGRNDLVDPDQDGDGVPDFVESGASGVDSDYDGLDDSWDPSKPLLAAKARQRDRVPHAKLDLRAGAGLTDSDKDGIANALDLDSDGDGVADTVEAKASGNDSDGDGIDDAFDIDTLGGADTDGNGIPDGKMSDDADGDGISDYVDLDSDNDGVPDVVESGGLDQDGDGLLDEGGSIVTAALDTDGDGTPDYLDLDSDGDGIFDIAGTPAAKWDADGDGRIDDASATDEDGDGIADVIDAEPGQSGGQSDADGDSVPAHLDQDDDNDGIADVTEAALDIDGDGVTNPLDHDSDNDGIVDRIESGRLPPSGIDSDADGLDDAYDADATGGVDDDGDGVDDQFVLRDTDGDGTPDHLDEDSDNDGLSDAYEVWLAALSGADSDGDGIDDAIDVDETGGIDANHDGVDDAMLDVVDTDNDGLENYRDEDSDNDRKPDGIEDQDSNQNGIIDRLEYGPFPGAGGGSVDGMLAALFGLMALWRRRRMALQGPERGVR